MNLICTGDLVTMDEPTSPNFGKVGEVVKTSPTTITIAPTTNAPHGRNFGVNLDGSHCEYPRSIVRRTCDRPESGHLLQGAYWTVASE
jgi:hypothetical protein